MAHLQSLPRPPLPVRPRTSIPEAVSANNPAAFLWCASTAFHCLPFLRLYRQHALVNCPSPPTGLAPACGCRADVRRPRAYRRAAETPPHRPLTPPMADSREGTQPKRLHVGRGRAGHLCGSDASRSPELPADICAAEYAELAGSWPQVPALSTALFAAFSLPFHGPFSALSTALSLPFSLPLHCLSLPFP